MVIGGRVIQSRGSDPGGKVMALLLGSEEWIDALQEELNQSAAYAQAAADWEGDFYFILQPDEPGGEPVCYYVDLWHGACREASRITDRSAYSPEFQLSASLSTWRQMIEGQLDPIAALMTRRLKVQGDLGKLMGHVEAAKELVACLTRIETAFPDWMAP